MALAEMAEQAVRQEFARMELEAREETVALEALEEMVVLEQAEQAWRFLKMAELLLRNQELFLFPEILR